MKRNSLWNKVIAGGLALVMCAALLPQGTAATTVSAAVTNTTDTLAVDMTAEKGELTHGAAGFLYGVSSEDVPTTNTIVPLNAKVLSTKGALGTEHPYGDALDVAKTFLEAGGEQIMMYNSNYYGVFGVMTDYKVYAKDLKEVIAPAVVEWKNAWKAEHGTPEDPKDAIGARVDIDKAIIYVPINEGTPNWGAKDFGVAWQAYFEAIMEADPNATIAGTNDWYYNRAFGYKHDSDYEVENITEEDQDNGNAQAIVDRINAAEAAVRSKDENGNAILYNLDYFLPHCIENDCMPHIITWHELDPDALIKMADHKADFTAKWNKYYQEAIDNGTIDLTAVPKVPQIVINEYATGYDCGLPGRLVNWIARLEDNEMYGCLPFWHQANDLNDLASEANEGNGAWWAFKWYGDMSGQRLEVSSTAYYDELYGIAAIDDAKKSARVLFGGQEGNASIVLNNVDDTDAFKDATSVHIKVEVANLVGMEGSEYAPPTILEGDVELDSNGSFSVSLANMKFEQAYCLTVTASEGDEDKAPLTSTYMHYYEAEEAELSGDTNLYKANASSTTYSGPAKYLSGEYGVLTKKGGKIVYTIEVPTDGHYKLTYVYGNGTGTLRNDADASLGLNIVNTMQVDGGDAVDMTLPNTVLTNNTGNHVEYVDLKAGTHTVTVTFTDDTAKGEVIHDAMIVAYDGAYNEGDALLDRIYEAEEADFNTLTSNNTFTTNTTSAVKIETAKEGFSGTGYVTDLCEVSVEDGGGIRHTVVVAKSGLYNMTLRYLAKADGIARIYVGNTDTTLTNLAATLNVVDTDGAWKTTTASVYLQKGINIVDIDNQDADGTVDFALDYLRVRQLDAADVADFSTTIEAEDTIPAGAEITVKESAGASKGQYVGKMDGSETAKETLGQYLEFTYEAEEAGYYQMQVFQSNDELCGSHSYNTKSIDKYLSISVKDKDGNETSDNRYFFINTYSQDTFKEKSISVYMNAGVNTIRVYNDDSWNVLYGGSQSVAGTKVLKNTTPNLDKFVITPQTLETAIDLSKEYAIDIRTTMGGYATSAQNTVSEGEDFDVTIVPETGIKQILVNGTDKTDAAQEQEDGTYALKIADVQEDVAVEIYFIGANNEVTDDYIKNPGFGTGDTTFWDAESVEVAKEVVDSYDGYYARLSNSSTLSQKVTGLDSATYFLGVYSKGSADAAGKVVLKAIVTSENGYEKTYDKVLSLTEDYQENALKLRVMEGMDVTINVDTSGLTAGSVYLDNFGFAVAPTQDSMNTDKSVVYFVDAGDNNVNTLPTDEKYGARNSVTDQVYGVDQTTGYKWGVVTTADDCVVDAKNLSTAVWTKWQAGRSWDSTDHSDKNETWRCTDFQNADNGYTGDVKYIRYAFELEPGTYTVETGYWSLFGSSWGGNVTMYANGEKVADVDMANCRDENNDETIAYVDTQTVTIDEEDLNTLLLSYERPRYFEDGTEMSSHYITSIKITKAGDAVDLTELSDLYELVKGLSNEDGTYAEGYWNVFEEARTAAKGYLDQADELTKDDQTAVNECLAALEAAYDRLMTASKKVNNSYLYYVDCGDANPQTVASDSYLGTANTLTDQVFAADPITGKEWGLYDPAGGRDSYVQGGRAVTRWIGAQDQGNADNSTKKESFVFAEGQTESSEVEKLYVSYKFQVDSADGIYPIEIGLSNTWHNAMNPEVYGNYGTDSQVTLSEGAGVSGGANVVVSGEVQAVDGYITVDVRKDKGVSDTVTMQVTYLTVGQEKSAAPTPTPTPDPTPTPTPDPTPTPVELPFEDVTETDPNFAWFGDAITSVYEQGIMNGYTETQFAPYENTIRADFALTLYRIAGKPAVTSENTFPDVQDGAYYVDAVIWASEQGVVTGYEDGNFHPDDKISRQDMVVMLYRYAGKPVDEATGDYSEFTDADQVADYAADAIKWALAKGLVKGNEDGTLAPQKNITRAEIAVILDRFVG